MILITTISCGVCHTDIPIHDGYFDLCDEIHIPARVTENLAMGHEIFGEVVEVGEQVKNIEMGTNYVVYPWIGCGNCNECQKDKEHYCSPCTAAHIGV